MTTTPLPPLPAPMWPQSGRERPYVDAYSVANMQAYAAQARADLEAENAKFHKLMAWIIDECCVYPEGDEAKAFANRLIAAITHPKAGAELKETP